MPRAVANLLLLLAGAIWGAAFVSQSTAMESIGPYQFVGFRFLLAGFVVLPLALFERSRKPTKRLTRQNIPLVLAVSLSFLAGSLLQQVGILFTSVTNAGFLTAIYVVLTPIFVILLFKGKPEWVIWPASLITLLGIFFLSGGNLSGLNKGDALMVICAAFWALQVIFIGRLSMSTGRPITIAAIQFLITGAIASVLGLFIEPLSWAAIENAAFELFFAGAISGGIAFTLQAVAQQWTRPADAAIFISTEALFAALFGIIFLGERIPLIGIAGCLLIFTAILMTELVPMYFSRKTRLAAKTSH
ncbi:DMT family transporter [Flexibacterium corallicola]|uniref:DMT family transporter n=1 Tax=Flexibacterium corallicola TaxID=3037259 RepID=UPI00286F31EB|nr:DMT family transporter [Pseudovibrio sp. M1P-2-3]